MQKTNTLMRLTRFIDLQVEQLAILPSKITRLHDKWKRGISVPSHGFIIWPSVIKSIVDFNQGEVKTLPQVIKNELLSMYHQMGYEKSQTMVAVRGALSVEDQSNASWAGGSESPTNIIGEENFLNAVITCIRETFNGSMDAYAKQMGIEGDIQLSILVHDMAKTDAFAIVFTSNPLNGSSDEVLIQATFGGGELLTAGDESGDIFSLNRSGKLIKAQVLKKRQMVTPNGVVDIPSDMCLTQSLTETQLAELVAFSLKIEAFENEVPQDCEIAIAFNKDGSIHCTLVQNRPVTTEVNTLSLTRGKVIAQIRDKSSESLKNLEEMGCQAPFDVFSDQNIVELLTQRPTRFSFGLFTYIFAHGDAGIRIGRNMMGYEIGNELNEGFFQLIGGQARVSIIKDALTYRIAGIPLSDYFQGFVLTYLEQIKKDARLANYPEVVLYKQQPTLAELTELFGSKKATSYYQCYQNFFAGIREMEENFASEFTIKHGPALKAYVESQKALNWQLMSSHDLLDVIQGNLDYLRTKACVWFVVIARLGFFAYARLRRDLEKSYGKERSAELLDKLTSGLKNDPTTQFHIQLAKLRDGLISTEDLLDGFGHLGFNELEISGPRFRENPEVFSSMARQLSGNPATELEGKMLEMEAATKLVLEECSTNTKDNLEKDINSARKYLAYREWAKHHYLRIYDLLRSQLLCLEKQLGWSEGDIFYLDPRELSLIKSDLNKIHDLISLRKEKMVQNSQVEIPQVIFTNKLEVIGRLDLPNSATELDGIGVTSYVSEGIARIVTDPKDKTAIENIQEGDILVTPTTDPTWSAIMASLGFGKGGLITEVGGPLAHGAVIARELHLGAVLNVPHATKIIKNGQRIRVDGPAGKVYLL